MFIHVSFIVIAVVYNTVIVAKSHVFFSVSHTILHIFKSLSRRYLVIIKMSSVLLRTVCHVEFQENSHLTFENLCNYVQLTLSPKLDK